MPSSAAGVAGPAAAAFGIAAVGSSVALANLYSGAHLTWFYGFVYDASRVPVAFTAVVFLSTPSLDAERPVAR